MNRPEALQKRETSRRRLHQALASAQAARDSTEYGHAMQELRQVGQADIGYFEPHYQLGCAYQLANAADRAQAEFLAAVRCDPLVGGDAAASYRVYNCLAEWELKGGHVPQALRYYGRFLSMYPLTNEAADVALRISTQAAIHHAWWDLFLLGCQTQMNGGHDEACHYFAQSCQSFAGIPSAYLRMAASLRATHRLSDAVQALEYGFSIDPASWTLVEIGALYGQLAQPNEEERYYRRALELNAADPLVLYQLGYALAARAHREEPFQLLSRAVELAPEAPWAQHAQSLIDGIQQTMAEECPPWLTLPVQWKRWSHSDEGLDFQLPPQALPVDEPDARDLFAVEDRQSRPVFRLRLRRLVFPPKSERESFIRTVESLYCRTEPVVLVTRQKLMVSGQPAHMFELNDEKTDDKTNVLLIFRGNDVFEMVLRSPHTAYVQTRKVLMQIVEGARILNHEELNTQRRYKYEKIIERNPHDEEAVAGLLRAFEALGAVEEVVKVCNQMLKTNPKNVSALTSLAAAAMELDNANQAVKLLETAVSLKTDKDLLVRLGQAYEAKGKMDQAVKSYTNALSLAPKDVPTRIMLGRAYESQKKLKDAEAHYKMAVTLNEEDIEARILLGFVCRKQKRLEEAVNSFRQVLKLEPHHLNASLMLGICQVEMGDLNSAEKTFRDVLAVHRGHPAAASALKEVLAKKAKSHS